MKPCEQYKDIILTDYIDGEVEPKLKAQIDAHLLSCAGCRELYQDIKSQLSDPLEHAPRVQVPSRVWDSIKENIEEQRAVPVGFSLGQWLKDFNFIPRVAPVFMTIALMFFVTTSVHHQIQIKQAQEKGQVQYLASLVEVSDNTTDSTDANLGTTIEEYFL